MQLTRGLLWSLLGSTSVVVTAQSIPNTNFNGTGQIRTLLLRPGTDEGCITNAGLWTVDESLCGVFTSNRDSNPEHYPSFTLSSPAGACGITRSSPSNTYIVFRCGGGVSAALFGVSADVPADVREL